MVEEDPNKVFTLQGKSVKNVKISSDSFESNIIAILVLHDGHVLVADHINKKIKLLDQRYQVVSHCGVSAWQWDLCLITASEVAVTVSDTLTNTHEVQFLTVNNSLMVTGKKLQLPHECIGIAFHQGDLYITANTALYKYTLNGKLVSKIYEDKAHPYTGKNQT